MDRELIEEMEKELEALGAQADDRTKARILAWEIFKEKHEDGKRSNYFVN